jgi:hypothetical protein
MSRTLRHWENCNITGPYTMYMCKLKDKNDICPRPEKYHGSAND